MHHLETGDKRIMENSKISNSKKIIFSVVFVCVFNLFAQGASSQEAGLSERVTSDEDGQTERVYQAPSLKDDQPAVDPNFLLEQGARAHQAFKTPLRMPSPSNSVESGSRVRESRNAEFAQKFPKEINPLLERNQHVCTKSDSLFSTCIGRLKMHRLGRTNWGLRPDGTIDDPQKSVLGVRTSLKFP